MSTANEKVRIDTTFTGELAQKLTSRLAKDKDQNPTALVKRLLLIKLDEDEDRANALNPSLSQAN